MAMERPTGMTVICLLLGWLTLAAAGNAVLLLSGQFQPMPRWFGLFAIAYGVTAAVSVFKLWKMDTAGHQWLRAWMAVCVVLLLAMMPIFVNFALGGIAGMLAFLVLMLLLFWALDRYVSRALTRGA